LSDHRELSIWFFIGVSLFVNGVLVLGAGIHDFLVPPAEPLVLASLHAPIWWGALMLLVGAGYALKFAPKRSTRAAAGLAGRRGSSP
jgi:hypothetical protein